MKWVTAPAFAVLAALAASVLLSMVSRGPPIAEHPMRNAFVKLAPLMGGLAIFVALVGAAWNMGILGDARYFLLAMCLILAIGLWSDFAHQDPGMGLALQVVGTAIVAWVAGIEFRSLGSLFGGGPMTFLALSLPAAVFSIVALSHSVNMMGDLEGFRGSFAFVALAWFAAAAAGSGLQAQLETALVLAGAIAGYLLCILLFRNQPYSRVILGKAGGLMIGFALGWFALDVTQGAGRKFPPIAAIWVVLLPLADCFSVMLRRFVRGQNPFQYEERYIHHYLFAKGFAQGQTLFILIGMSALLGAVGYMGWRFKVPEPELFWLAFFVFLGYHAWVTRAWKRISGFDFVI